VRLFLAINLDPEMRAAIFDAAAPLREAAPDLRWSAADRLHLTLKFLGEQPESAVAGISAATDRVSAAHYGFDMRVGDSDHTIGAFPNFRRPRVVWVGVATDPRLELLHHDVEVACETLGFALEGRPFRPHITLARIADRVDATVLRKLERATKKVTFDAESPVASVELMRSVTGPTARYEQVHTSPLRSR
jgi:2'-5' RNA ligase